MNGVRLGTPITSGQAARAVLRMISSPIVGDIEVDASPGSTLMRLRKQDPETGRSPYDYLSKGERHPVDIAHGIWAPGSGARLDALGGIDHKTRRKVLVILFYLHLGHDALVQLELEPDEFVATFGAAE